MRGSPSARLVPFLLTVLALAPAGLACSGKANSSNLDASGTADAELEAGGGGAGGTGAVGGGVGGAPAGEGGRIGAGGTPGVVDAGTDSAGPDLTNCPIRSCVQKFAALQAGCAAFGAACVKEVYGSQTNYCLANGVRTYLDSDGVTGLATMIKPDGHTCYTIYLTYPAGTGPTTGAIKDPEGAVVMYESDSSDNKTITFICNGVQWVEDGVSCGAGGINAFPFLTVDCPKTTGQMCLRP